MTWILISVLYTTNLFYWRSCVAGYAASGLHEPELSCSFKSDLCGWTSVPKSSWNLKHPRSVPQRERTIGDDSQILLLNKTSRPRPLPSTLVSGQVSTFNETCLQFWYYMHGNDIGSLFAFSIDEAGTRRELFRKVGFQGPKWYNAAINTGSGNFTILIQGTYSGPNNDGFISLDDIFFSYQGPCLETDSARNQPQVDCDFENKDYCSWHYGPLYYRPWHVQRHGFHRDLIGYGQEYVSTDSNHYEHFPYEHNLVHLTSPTFSIDTSGACLTFWYKVDSYRNRKDPIAFLKRFDHGETVSRRNEEDNLFELAATPRIIWVPAYVTLLPGRDSYISFILNNPSWYPGAVYLDDIKLFKDGPCTKELRESVITCDFEKDFCQWLTISQREFIRTHGPTQSRDTGPSHDHTSGAGYYVYFDAVKRKDDGSLRSRVFKLDSEGACLSFWYHMYGEDVDELILYMHRPQLMPLVLWTQSGDQGDRWIQEKISIQNNDYIYLKFVATKGYFPRGDIALDDITISFDGPCQNDTVANITTPAVSTSSTTETLKSTEYFPVLSFLPLPTLSVHGETNPIFVHSRVELVCGDPIDGASYKWFKKEGRDFGELTSQGNRSLLFERVRLDHAGTYMCSVSKPGFHGRQSKAIDLKVEKRKLPAPSLTADGLVDPLYEDSRVEITCIDTSNASGISYIWKRQIDSAWESLDINEQNLYIDEVKQSDSGIYKCIIKKKDFVESESDVLQINVVSDPRPRPVLTADYTNYPQLVHEKFTLTCGTKVVDRGVYHWKTDSEAFASTTIPSSRFLVIPWSKPFHSGNYSCRISKDEYFTAKSNTIRLNIVPGKPCTSYYHCRGDAYLRKCEGNRCKCSKIGAIQGQECKQFPRKPTISISPDYTNFGFGDTFYITCNFHDPIPPSIIYRFMKGDKDVVERHEHETFNILKISNATIKDQGGYVCLVNVDNLWSLMSLSTSVAVREFVNLNCDFSNGFCNWYHISGSNTANFTLHQRETILDHHHAASELSDGHDSSYIHLHKDNTNQTRRALLRSPDLEGIRMDPCMTFWYRMHGPDVYSLSVWRHYPFNQWLEPTGFNVWTVIGDQGAKWIKQTVTIPAKYRMFVQFVAIGDVAIDNISFNYRGECDRY